MILTGTRIGEEHKNNKIKIDPFYPAHINTNSYDLTLGSKFIRYTNEIIDPAVHNAYTEFEVGEEGISLNSGDFILGHSQEIIGSSHFVPIIHAKSSIARLGIFVHVTADLVDIGFQGNITFQLYSTLNVKLYPGMKIGQVSFWVPKGDIESYQGKYQNAKGPAPSQIHKDFSTKLAV